MIAPVVLGAVLCWMLAAGVYGYRHRPRPVVPLTSAEQRFLDGLTLMGIEAVTLAAQLGEALVPAIQAFGAEIQRAIEGLWPGTREERWLGWHWPHAPRIVWWLAGSDWNRKRA